jgi:hypothetical protein
VTLSASLAWTLVRAVALLLIFGPLCPVLAKWVRGSAWRWCLLAAPFVFPELLVGYAYAPWIAGQPWVAEVVCALQLGLRALPVGVVAWELAPPGPVTSSALYCRRMALRDWADRWDLIRLWMAGPLRKAIPAAGLFLLVAFQEFELAALLRAVSWTDWLFVSQVAGMTLSESLLAALQPTACELAGLAIVLWAVGVPPSGGIFEEEERRPAEAGTPTLAWLFIAVAWLLVIVIPCVQLTAGLPSGVIQLAGQRLRWMGLLKEIAVGLSVSLVAAAVAWTLAGFLRRAFAATVLLCLPGLLGSLILSLFLLALFQRSLLSRLYDTPLPWLLGLTLFLAPRAVLLQVWSSAAPRSAMHLCELLRQSPDAHQRRSGECLLWELRDQPRFLAVALLAYWGYLELTLAYLLAPTGMTSGVVRLYNFMHFGRTSALSAEAAVLLFTPLLGTWCLWMLWRWRTMRTT